MTPTDRDLIRGCLKKDKASWDIFVERYSRLIYWCLHRALEHTAQASRGELVAELFQEVFARLLEKRTLSYLAKASDPKSYLASIARHTAQNRLKSMRRQDRGRVDLEQAPATTAEDPLAGMDRAEAYEAVRTTLEGLGRRERACVEHYYVEGLSHEQIATRLEVSKDTVSSILRRVKVKLQQRLMKKGIF